MIRHLVMWKLTADDPSEKAQIVAELDRRFSALLPIIDGTQRLDIRADLGTTDGNWDVVLDSDFLDATALDFYQSASRSRRRRRVRAIGRQRPSVYRLRGVAVASQA